MAEEPSKRPLKVNADGNGQTLQERCTTGRCLISLYDVLSRKFLKLSNAQPAPPVASSEAATEAPHEADSDELETYAGFLRMSLEVVNVVLTGALAKAALVRARARAEMFWTQSPKSVIHALCSVKTCLTHCIQV